MDLRTLITELKADITYLDFWAKTTVELGAEHEDNECDDDDERGYAYNEAWIFAENILIVAAEFIDENNL